VRDPTQAEAFGHTDLVLACHTTPIVATIASTPDGTEGFVVDNFLAVEGSNVCTSPGTDGCGTLGHCAVSCFVQYHGEPTGNALTSYTPVPPLDISGNLAAGRNLVRFVLMDWGVLQATSDIWLVTNCGVRLQHGTAETPGRFLYHYDFPVELNIAGMPTRITGRPRHAFEELYRCFNCSFPIKGAPRAFPRKRQYMPLRACFVDLRPCRPAPVKFYTNNAYYIKLIAQRRHFDGKGSSVLFLFYTDQDGFLHLAVTAYVTRRHPKVSDEINKNQAFLRWQEFAQNLGRSLYNGPCPRGVCR
jgi:hypothetical protein